MYLHYIFSSSVRTVSGTSCGQLEQLACSKCYGALDRQNRPGRGPGVTGASAGTGAAICRRLADEGLRVVGLARREELVQKLQADVTGPGRIHAMRCDVGKADEIATAFQRVERELGGVDLLVNNAALLLLGHITEAGSKPLQNVQIQQMVDVNITGLILCSRYAVASMKRRRADGHIININSVTGHYIPSMPLTNLYPPTKHTVTAFCTAINDELAHTQARIKITVRPYTVMENYLEQIRVFILR